MSPAQGGMVEADRGRAEVPPQALRSLGPAGVVGAIVLLLGACSAQPAANTPDQPSATARGSLDAPTGPRGSPSGRVQPGPISEPPARPSPGEQARLDARLLKAAWTNDVVRARRLISRGADVNAKDDTVQSAYLIAASEGYLRLLNLTLRLGARVNDKDSFNGTGLIRAADRGHADIVGRLVAAGIDVDHVNRLGWTALHEAIILGDGSQRYVDTVRVLVAAGVDVTRRSVHDRVTPYEHAASRRYGGMAELLRRAERAHGPDDRRGANHDLLAATARGDADAVALALRGGANLEARDTHGRTALLLAVTRDRLAVARVLVALGAGSPQYRAIVRREGR